MRRTVNLPRQKRSDLMAEEIKRWIVTEGKRPGDRLPKERDLIAIFGVSKGTVRESLKSLEVQGLIRLQTGPNGGAYISDVSYEVTAELLGNYFFFAEVGAKEIYSLRKLIEPELAYQALPTLSVETIAKLRETLTICEEQPRDQEQLRLQRTAELEFHNILADACPNVMLSFMCKFINQFLAEMLTYKGMYVGDQDHIRNENLDAHRKIMAAIGEKDAEGLRQAMKEHMFDCECHVVELEAVVTSKFLNREALAR
jgi:GntR family transcriptional regulator, transcriptional repressor for pyruvate dehydrogenase complex